MYPAAPDPRTGRRQLEQLAFEIVSQQSLGYAGRKAAKLAGRGVRRVFAIHVERSRALEWSAERDAWRELDAAGYIEDPALQVPLPIETIIHAARTDDAVQRALIAKSNSVLEAHVAAHRTQAKTEAVLTVLAARKIAVGDAPRAQILGERDPVQLDRWLAEAATCAGVAELLMALGRR